MNLLLEKRRTTKYIKRPLVVTTLFYILGLIGGKLHYDLLQFSLFCVLILVVVICMYIYYRSIYVWMYWLISLIGILSMIFNPILEGERLFAKNDQLPIFVEGKVLEINQYTYNSIYTIKPYKILINNKTMKVKSNFQIVGKNSLEVELGDVVSANGKVQALSFMRNPGSFDEKKYLLIRNVIGKVKANKINIESKNKDTHVFKKTRDYYGNMFEKIMPWDEAQIMKSMLIGDKTFLSPQTKELYQQVGISHILAISGLHISIISGMLWWVLNKLKFPNNMQVTIILVTLWGYAAVIGFSISITRAVIMTTVILIGKLLDEKSDKITSLCFAGLILLVYRNLYLWDIGFQLSFGAVASLILLKPPLDKIFIIPERIRKYITPLLAVTIGTTPIMAYYYYIVSPIGIVANLLLIPALSIAVIIGFVAMLVYPIHILIAKWLIGGAYYILCTTKHISNLVLKIPFATIIIGRPSWLEIIAYILFFSIIIFYLNSYLEQRKVIKNKIIIFCILLLMVTLVKRTYPQNLQVTFLDVGQGDCIVIETPYHKTFIIDGGNKGNGKKIEQFLKYKGIRDVDAIILSHAHSDHMSGLQELILRYPTQKIFLSEIPIEDEPFIEFYDTIRSRDIPIYNLSSEDFIKDNNILLECIYPIKGIKTPSGNNSSAVVVLTYKDVSYYFTGDIESPYEEILTKYIQNNIINVLKVPHHGSNTSSTQSLIGHVMPDIAVISCGKSNIYGHPHEEVLARYINNDIPIMETKDVGAIIMRSNGKKVLVSTMKDKESLWK